MSKRVEYVVDLDCLTNGSQGASPLVDTHGGLCDGSLLELLLACARQESSSSGIQDIHFSGIRLLPGADVAVVAEDRSSRLYELRSRTQHAVSTGRPLLHAYGFRSEVPPPPNHQGPSSDEIRQDGLDATSFYEALAAAGIPKARAFRLVDGVQMYPHGVLAELRRPSDQISAQGAFVLHPMVIDAALQVAAWVATRVNPAANRLVYIGFLSVLPARGVHPSTVSLHLRRTSVQTEACDMQVLGSDGAPIAYFQDVRFQTVDMQRQDHVTRRAAQIVEVARRVLQRPDLTQEDNLVAAGATSLDLLRIFTDLDDDWGWSASLEDALEDSTPIALALGALAERESQFPSPVESPSDSNDHGAFDAVLTYAEQRFWYLERFATDNSAYNESAAWFIDGRLDVQALERALTDVVERHEILRTAFPETDGEPRRKVYPTSTMKLSVQDLDESEVETESLNLRIAHEASHKFALDTAPLLRATILRVSPLRHVFVLTVHHIICDGWSAELLQREIAESYQPLEHANHGKRRHPAALMSSYATWERQSFRGQRLDDLLDWWAGELAEVPKVFELPADHTRQVRQAHAGARVHVSLTEHLADGVRNRSREFCATPFIVLLVAYQVLLFRYSGQPTFLLGVPFSLRRGRASEQSFGCLINTIPIRSSLHRDMSFCQAVQEAKVIVARASSRRHAPFDQIVGRVCHDRSLSCTPLAQVAFSYHEQRAPILELSGTKVRPIAIDPGTSKFDLMLEISDNGEGFDAFLEYNTDLFEPRRIAQMASHFRTILEHLTVDPTATIDGDWLLSESEGQQLRVWEAGVSRAGTDLRTSVDARMEEGVERSAIVSGSERKSYAWLATEVSKLAGFLAGWAVDSRLVAVCIGRSIEWVVTLAALLKVRRGYLPIDPGIPKTRALEILRISGIRHLLHVERDCPWWREFDGVCVDLSRATPSAETGVAHVLPSDAVTTAYAIATSGSTGSPKLAAVGYAGLSNLVDWYVRYLEADSGSAFLVLTSVGFDLTQKNVFAALCAGARVVLAAEDRFDPREIVNLIEREGVTVLNCTPTMFYLILDRCALDDYSVLRSLKRVILGGEPIDAGRLRSWMEHPGFQAHVTNSYGPSECSDVCAVHEIDSRVDFAEGVIPIGRPIPNVALQVIDPRGRRVPTGVAGELCISGVAVGEGYLGAGDRSDAFAKMNSGVAAYKTGDVVCRRWDGELVFVGRKDDQLKVHGYRITLGEVEAAMRRCAGIIDASAAVWTVRERQVLCGYYVAQTDVKRGELRRHLQEVLPGYMVPSSLMRLAALPLTPSGKVDRLALPMAMEAGGSGVDPRNEMERKLIALWRKSLGREMLSVEDNFFEVGGHSLLAVEVADAIEKSVGRRCSVTDVFKCPTVALLSEELEGRAQSRDRSET
jgi:amino acid adenylation domain-containing protein